MRGFPRTRGDSPLEEVGVFDGKEGSPARAGIVPKDMSEDE